MFVRHHFEDIQYICSRSLQTPSITKHILKAYDESYSKIIRANDKDSDKDKDTDKVPEIPSICYIFEILMTH